MKNLFKKPLAILIAILLVFSSISVAVYAEIKTSGELTVAAKFRLDSDKDGTYEKAADDGTLLVKKGDKVVADVYLTTDFYAGYTSLFFLYDNDILSVDTDKHVGFGASNKSLASENADFDMYISNGVNFKENYLIPGGDFSEEDFDGKGTIYVYADSGVVTKFNNEKLFSIYFTVNSDESLTLAEEGLLEILPGAVMTDDNDNYPIQVDSVDDSKAGAKFMDEIDSDDYYTPDEYEYTLTVADPVSEVVKFAGSVTYDVGEGAAMTGEGLVKDGNTYVDEGPYDTAATLAADVTAPTGKVFLDWANSAENAEAGTLLTETEKAALKYSDVTLYAVYGGTVTYDVGEGATMTGEGLVNDGSKYTATGVYGKAVTLATGVTAPSGKVFKGWASSAANAAAGTVLSDTEKAALKYTNITLYAVYEAADTSYEVRIFKMGTDGNYPDDPDEVKANQPGKCGEALDADALKALNEDEVTFAFDEFDPETPITLSANSEDNIQNVYFKRNKSHVKFVADGETVSEDDYYIGAAFPAAPEYTPDEEKYEPDFTWSGMLPTVPAAPTTVTAVLTDKEQEISTITFEGIEDSFDYPVGDEIDPDDLPDPPEAKDGYEPNKWDFEPITNEEGKLIAPKDGKEIKLIPGEPKNVNVKISTGDSATDDEFGTKTVKYNDKVTDLPEEVDGKKIKYWIDENKNIFNPGKSIEENGPYVKTLKLAASFEDLDNCFVDRYYNVAGELIAISGRKETGKEYALFKMNMEVPDYIFLGWTLDNTAEPPVIDIEKDPETEDKNQAIYNTIVDHNRDYYPVYKAIPYYNVEFVIPVKYKDPAESIYKDYVKEGSDLKVPENPADIEDLYFVGWDINEDGSPDTLPGKVNSDIYAEAVYKEYYTVEFYNPDDNLISSKKYKDGDTLVKPADPETTTTETPESTVEKAFVGWDMEYEGKSADNIADNLPDTVTFSFKAYAEFGEKIYYTVTFKEHGNIFSGPTKVIKDSAFATPDDEAETYAKESEEFTKTWDLNGDGEADELPENVTENIVAEAIYKDVYYKVVFVVKGESVYHNDSVLKGTALSEIKPADPADPEDEKFVGWSIDGDYDVDDLPAKVEKDIYANAVFNKYYTVTFIVDGKTISSEKVLEGSDLEVPGEFEIPEGKMFAGWDTDNDEIGNVLPEKVTEDIEAIAVLIDEPVPPEEFTSTFYDTNSKVFYVYKGVEGSDILAPGENPTKFGYTFTGWADENGKRLEEYTDGQPAENINFYPMFEKKDIIPPLTPIIIGDDLTPIIVGGTIVAAGVAAGAAIANTAVITGVSVVGGATLLTGIHHLIKHTYTVKYIVDGEVYKTYKVLEGTKVRTPKDPTKDGSEFAGWTPEVPEKMPAQDLEFNATWVAEGAGEDVDGSIIPDTGSKTAGLAAFAAISGAAAAAYVLSTKKKDED